MNTVTFQELPIEAILPYDKNPRLHSAQHVKQIAASIREFGFLVPVLVDDDGNLIAGHGRVLAAKELGMRTVPSVVASHLSPAQRQAYIIADNQLTLASNWNEELLAAELKALEEQEFDLDLLGFKDHELEHLLRLSSPDLPEDIDEVEEPPENPVSVLGDVWLLGSHRLVCGDSTDADIVAKCLNGVKPHLMVTDPPYGVKYDANWRNEAERANGKPYGASAIGKVENDDRADWREAWALFPGDVAYVWHADRHASSVQASLEAAGFTIRRQIVWAKSHFAISRGDYHYQHEPCWYAVRKGTKGHWRGDRSQSTLWQIDHRKSETGHSTQKPVECMKRPIENNSSPGQALYEPFSGSGTTIVAAEVTGRICHAIELNPAYVDVACKRFQNLTGIEPKLEDGTPWSEVERRRLAIVAE